MLLNGWLALLFCTLDPWYVKLKVENIHVFKPISAPHSGGNCWTQANIQQAGQERGRFIR